MTGGPTADTRSLAGKEQNAALRGSNRRGRLLLSALAASLLMGTILAACGDSAPTQPSASEGLVQNRLVPNIPLVNADGQTTSLAAFKGKYVVMANFLSLCQDECPLITGAFLSMQRDVRAAGFGNQVVFAEVSVDPGRDTPGRLRAYSSEFGADWPLLTGTPTNLHALWNFFGVSYQIVPEEQPAKIDWYTGKPLTYDVDHTDGFILLDRRGHERFIDVNAPNLHGKLSKDLSGLLNAGGIHNLHNPSSQTWTVDDALAALSWLVGRNIEPAG